ncbi:MAG: tRNA (adenosine(37)-N6)-threonylcarbamoyltransferase complex transferase subunit TsaD [Candidatus Pacebacteria bacterium]|nr:tRNA (adenosine(37)-N6)-threonylcarbamoyltransferase complex transferase subunit TsaD [Candidatus Paceibacterota bacterium]
MQPDSPSLIVHAKSFLVLGIESSCDETAAAVVSSDKTILGQGLHSQFNDHRSFGGVVPEIAARAHLDQIERVISETMSAARIGFSDLTAVAATVGPGLIGGVIVGATTAKAIALAHGKKFIGINHLEAHALTGRLSSGLEFPYLLLLVSGGHSQILAVHGVGDYRQYGSSLDDALGEAFDKVAKMLGLGIPGGPAVEQCAKSGRSDGFALPRPMQGRAGCDFSFSGLKTAVRLTLESLAAKSSNGMISQGDRSDLAASFQAAAGDCLLDRLHNAVVRFRREHPSLSVPPLVIAGGVAANQYLRGRLESFAEVQGLTLVAPPLALCTDNGAMIAWAGIERLRLQGGDWPGDGLDMATRPRWPLDQSLDS